MRVNQRYASHATVLSIQVLGENVKPNPDHDQELKNLEYYNHSAPTCTDATAYMEVVV